MDKTIKELKEKAYRIRKHALRMAEVEKQGFISQALGSADIMAVLYFHSMKYTATDPDWEGRDRLLYSVGHVALGLYAALTEAGFIPEDELDTYAQDNSRLPMSSMTSYTPGIEISGGSIGLGLPTAVGTCLGLKQKKSDSFAYAFMGDGELCEGPTWEAAISASHYRLDNLIAVIDINGIQADGFTANNVNTEPVHDKFTACGWYVQRIDGNDLTALVTAFDNARNSKEPKPRAILCDTKPGTGVPFLVGHEKSHFIRLEPEDWKRAYEELEKGRA